MTATSATLRTGGSVAPVSPHLFGSFVEHMGRCVYTGLYEPGHPSAGEDGIRQDVLALTRELGTTVIRHPACEARGAAPPSAFHPRCARCAHDP